MRFSPRYWLRRWLVPELELSPREQVLLEAEHAEFLRTFDSAFSRPRGGSLLDDEQRSNIVSWTLQ